MTESRAQKLVDAGEFRKAAEWLDVRGQRGQSDRILRARLELEIGDSSLARSQADALLHEHLEKPDRASCMDILGRALARLGLTTQGLGFMQKAIALAADCDSQLHAALLAHYAKALLNWVGVEPALAVLPRLRKAALDSGNRRALVEYHISCARVSAIRGSWARADAEVRLSTNLLEVDPSLDQLWRLRQVQATMASKTCELTSAQSHAQEALHLAETIGSKPFIASTMAILAHIAAVRGDYGPARRYIDRTIDLLAPLSHIRFALYSTQIDIGLGSGDSTYAALGVRNGETLRRELATAPVYYQLWFELHHVRWLLCQGRNEDAAVTAVEALKSIESLADTNLLFRMRMLAAEASFKSQPKEDGTALAHVSSLRGGELNLEALAEMNRVAAVLSGGSGKEVAAKYLARASRILVTSGLLGLTSEVERTRVELGISGELLESSGRSNDGISALEAAALALQLGKQPRVLAAQVVTLLESLGISESATLCKEKKPNGTFVVEPASDAPPRDGAKPHQTLSFPVGSQEGTRYSVQAVVRGCREASMAWLAVDQIIQSAAATANPPAYEDEISLWPSETSAIDLGMVVAAESMREVLSTSRKLACSNITVLVTGETGTGKEVLARGLHEASLRKAKQFIPFNCGAVARDMLDAQLFGYRRGSFTGAQEAFQGVIRAASGGTLFLDEIGETPIDVQPKLLRFLESSEIHPLGESMPISVDVRVVAATNANLEQLVADGRFREDLFYRLNVVRLQVPPLRERREEIPPLVHYYLERGTRESRKIGIRFADETMEYLVLYRWPGNVRQLANEVRRLVALAEPGAVLMPEHLSHDIRASRRTIPASDRILAPTEFVVRLDQPLPAAIEHLERTMVQNALKAAGGRLEEAAQLLGLSRKGLYLKRQRLGISDVAPAEPAPTATS